MRKFYLVIGLNITLLFLFDLEVIAQSLVKASEPQPPYYSSILVEDGNKIGLGVIPNSKFHILTNISQDTALKIDASITILGQECDFGTIDFFKTLKGITYGIYQTTIEGMPLLNYFQNDVKIGKATIYSGHNGMSGIALDQYENNFVFSVSPSSGPTLIPLEINMFGITVKPKITTDEIQILTNPGIGKVLVSDAIGNGIWTDASESHDDDWLPISPHGESSLLNLYRGPNYQNVGIGTQDPLQIFHVCGGNILISRLPDEAPGSLNGSIYFGSVVTPDYPTGEWGIEYFNEGLNFWKVASATNPGANYCLFLRNDGNVGIGTPETYDYKLAIAGRVICEELKVKLIEDWPDYVFDKNHNLPSLQDVNKFISEHKHLPDVPSSQEVKENGVNIGEMNAVLLKKVEELTLYVIAMEKEMEQLKAQIKNK